MVRFVVPFRAELHNDALYIIVEVDYFYCTMVGRPLEVSGFDIAVDDALEVDYYDSG